MMKYLFLVPLSILMVACGGDTNGPALPPELQGTIDASGLPPLLVDPLSEFPLETTSPVAKSETAAEKDLIVTSVAAVQNSNVSCEAITQDLETSFADINFCETNDDCAVVEGSCPFGCFIFHNTGIDFSDYQPALTTYQDNCNPCEYKCGSAPRVNDRRCVEGRCIDARYIE